MDVVERLRTMAREHFATSAGDLRRIARGQGVRHSATELKDALKSNPATQVLAPKPAFRGKSAAEGQGARIQLDLAEFPQTEHDPHSTPYALVGTDVFTRQTYAEPLNSKSAEATDRAAKKVLDQMPREAEHAAVTTDSGVEFSHLQQNVLDQRDSVHRLKAGRNDISVVDRAMQTLKVKLAVARANEGGAWDSHLQNAVKAYNSRPLAVVHGKPDNAGNDELPQNFLVTQDNAAKFEHNRDLVEQRRLALHVDKAFRPAISDGSRAHKPRYGPVEEFGSVEPGALHVINTKGEKHLLKRVQPVPLGTEEPRAVFGTKPKPPPKDREEGEAPPARPHRPMTGPIPEPASRAFEPASSSSRPSGAASSSAAPPAAGGPAFTNPRSAGLAAMFGGHAPVRTPEEHAAYKAEAARTQAELADARRQRDAARRQKQRDEEDRRDAANAAREKAKADKEAARKKK